jgi:hypothetical protein
MGVRFSPLQRTDKRPFRSNWLRLCCAKLFVPFMVSQKDVSDDTAYSTTSASMTKKNARMEPSMLALPTTACLPGRTSTLVFRPTF